MSDENKSNSKKNFADQQDGKKSLDVETNAINTSSAGFQAIAAAYGDYTKKSFEDTKSFGKKLSSVKSIDQAIEVQIEFARTTCETFVEESQKIAALYGDLAKQTYGGFVTLSR
jgi:hypothetical protein